MTRTKVAACLLLATMAVAIRADNAKFDLVGPKLSVRVTRGTMTLPIAQVPNLLPGDRLWVKADLPANQLNHLLLIVAFLRGTTNEPPDNWFTQIETWDKKTVEGTFVTVPKDAEQALIFIAPETGGDFKTLRSAVKGRPGIFIRADADLNEASFEELRIQHYLDAMKTVPQNDPKAIQDHSAKLSATLALKPNADCFKQPVEQQVYCLTQTSAPVLLSDGHGQTVAEALSTGPSSDFINSASYTAPAGGGLYSAYVGSIVDLVHLVSLLKTAQYQYIPGIGFPEGETISLKLNAPPSFLNPKSVIVVGLPAIQKATPPPLHAHDASQVACLLQPKMALMVEGAPLVFSTSFAHDLVLHLNRTGANTDIPLKPDAFEGGLIVTEAGPRKVMKENWPGVGAKSDARMGTPADVTITGTVRGYWGFDPFEGPSLTLQQVDGKGWKIKGETQLMAGQDNHLQVEADATACVKKIVLRTAKGKSIDVSFKPATGDDGKDVGHTLALDASLKEVDPGGFSLAIEQYGTSESAKLQGTAFAGDIKLASLKMHKGDNTAVLEGSGLGSVASVEIGTDAFAPAGGDDKQLKLQAKAGVAPGDGSSAKVKLKDGRTMSVKVETEAQRPALTLVSFTATAAQVANALPVALGAKDDLPLNGKLTFVVQTKDVFPRSQTVEVATADGSVHTVLSLADNTLVLQDEHTAIATLDPLKAFGQSAFGKLQMRPIAQDGTEGDWSPLGTLVRLPQISAVQCTTAQAPACVLNGKNLFLVKSFSGSEDFGKAVDVPTGFAEGTFSVPTPVDGATLYVKLRDDPSHVASVTLASPISKAAPAQPAAAPAAGPSQTPPAL